MNINSKDILELLLQFDNPSKIRIMIEYQGFGDLNLERFDRLSIDDTECDFENNILTLIVV